MRQAMRTKWNEHIINQTHTITQYVWIKNTPGSLCRRQYTPRHHKERHPGLMHRTAHQRQSVAPRPDSWHCWAAYAAHPSNRRYCARERRGSPLQALRSVWRDATRSGKWPSTWLSWFRCLMNWQIYLDENVLAHVIIIPTQTVLVLVQLNLDHTWRVHDDFRDLSGENGMINTQ